MYVEPDEIDALVVEMARPRWRKVFLIIGLVAEQLIETGQSDGLAEHWHAIHARVLAAVDAGRLEVVGDRADPTRSEVRLLQALPGA